MIERAIFDIIVAGIEYLQANAGAVTDFLSADGVLEAGEAAKVEEYFLRAINVSGDNPDEWNVVHGYARPTSRFPCFAVTLGNDEQTTRYLGDDGGMIGDAEEFATEFALTYNILIYAQSPDVVLYLYQILKQVLINGFPILKAAPYFLSNLRLSGADMAPDKSMEPAGLFLRRVTITCEREYQQTVAPTNVGRARKVQGIHIDAQGAVGEDVGNVKTQVYPVDEE